MTAQQKLAYYHDREMHPQLAARYYRAFAGARTILDLGCGTGTFGRHRPRRDIVVYGVDADAGAVRTASAFERAVCIDLERAPLPFPDAMFDGVLAKDIFEHVQDPGRLVREAHRVLKPQGVIVVSVVMAKPARVWADYTHVRGFTLAAAQLLLRDAGLEIEDVWKMGPVPGARRFGLVAAVPQLLRFPLFDFLWASSWELTARKPPTARLSESDTA
jgi:SAM-dependent methyltransferase